MNLITENISVGKFEFRVSRIADIDNLLEALLKKGEDHEDVKDERIPYWAELWPSAIALSKFLVENNSVRPGMEVLEIGCGLGLPGMTAAKMGAHVTFSDYLPEALQAVRVNATANDVANADYKLLDWRAPMNVSPGTLVLASDVAYERRSFETLLRCIDHFLFNKASVILSEPNRLFAKGFIETLISKERDSQAAQYEIDYRDFVHKVNVYQFNRK